MEIYIKCECGNKASMLIKNKKVFVVRDNLEKDDFYFAENEISDGKTREIHLKCNKCNRWVSLI